MQSHTYRIMERIKSKRLIIAFASIVTVLAATPLVASAVSTLTNGSFESGVDPGTYLTLNAPNSTSITGWSVVSGSVDYIGSYWTASNGTRSLDMSGNEPGAISQTFSTIVGHTYTVSFDMAGNPDGAPQIKTMNVDTGAAPTAYTFDTTGATHTSMGWQQKTYDFTATTTSTVLTFTSTTTGPYGPALDNVVLTDVLQNKDQCKHDGWKAYTNPSFSSQKECERFVDARAHGRLIMADPHQKIKFNISKQTGDPNTVEYWNYDYPGGLLHYTAAVTCSYINPATGEARFMFQIPDADGHPGLSGLYVVAYVKDVEQKGQQDLYGHSATADQATATTWCQTGAGFSPTMYPVTDGFAEVG